MKIVSDNLLLLLLPRTLLFVSLFCLVSSVSGIQVFSDVSVLLEFKSTVSDPHGILSSWSPEDAGRFCSWFGVTCNSEFKVVSINIVGGGDDAVSKGNNFGALSCSKSLEFPFRSFGIERTCPDYGKKGKLKGKLSPLIGKLSELTVLQLPFNELDGEIPVEIWGLDKLEFLDLEGNLFVGRLPSEIVGLKRLRVLNLGFNRFDGEIPTSLTKLAGLKLLNLAGNKLKGSVPSFLVSSLKLRGLYLGNNELNGSVPGVWGINCRYLEYLDLSGNFLVGGIPGGLGNCRQLKTLLLYSNMLTGGIPHELGQLRRLEVMDVSRNSLSGVIPAELGNCVELSVLILSSLFETWPNRRTMSASVASMLSSVARDECNSFQGSIPSKITTLPRLRVLWAPGVALEGILPMNWGECESLEMVNLAKNGLSGNINGVFERCKKLYFLDLSSNGLSGELDKKLPVPCMTFFDVSHNLMSGSIPRFNFSACPPIPSLNSHIVQAQGPSSVYLSFLMHKTVVSSHLPFSATSLAVNHNFGGNNFTGSIYWLPIAPERFGKKMEYAFLASGNKLSGLFPGSLFRECDKLHGMIANISKNNIAGELPLKIGAICRSLKFLDASDNQISGPVPPSLGNLKYLAILDLSRNKLQGPVPSSLHRLKNLKCISLAGNSLIGAIPSNLGPLRPVDLLNVSSNSLSGGIPGDIINSENLTTLLLSDNNKLLGQVPSGLANARSLSTTEPFPLNGSVVNCGSDQTCHVVSLSASAPESVDSSGDQPGYGTSPSESGTGSHKFNSIEIASIASASAIVSVLLVLVVLFFYARKWNPDARVQVSEPKEITVFVEIGVPLLYEHIVQATGNFNVSKCIGNGGFGATYKAEISPGTLLAVKRLAVGRFQGVQQFRAEIKALGRVRHPNLVTLIGYHASETEMFLIYNYLPGGNLENFIKERSINAVNWKIIHKIALDIARALAYLHDQCAPRVLHRDVKPSNILLDNDFNAYLSDFGLSRLLGTSETHATTGVAGTFGYVAPEYAMTCRVSEKADVYSYGVVLLELISDKKALDPSFSSHENGFNIVSWAHMLLRHGQAKDVFNERIWESGPHDNLVEMLHLAVTCTVDSLSSRPTMKQAVQRLRQIKPS